jgi:hypothetical protein
MLSHDGSMSLPSNPTPPGPDLDEYESIDLRVLWERIAQGFYQILGLGLLGSVIAGLGYFVTEPRATVATSTRVIFSFPGFEKGQYPDKSKFQPDDLRSPTVIATALGRQGLDNSAVFQSVIRGALDIEGVISPEIVKERDRVRAAGLTPPLYIPDEYTITLSLPRSFPISDQKRESLLIEIVSEYRARFRRAYVEPPLAFGNVFAALSTVDLPDYELFLGKEMENITDYLHEQASKAPSFRSRTTNLSFNDLINQTQLFTRIYINETLGQIYINGLARHRQTAVLKMDYYIQTLEDQENKAVEEEKIVEDLLSKAQEHSQSYVLGIKTAAGESASQRPMVDQGLLDSLLANDAYSFLVHQALEAGLKVRDLQAEITQVAGRRKSMQSFANQTDTSGASALYSQVEHSLGDLKVRYDELISDIRKTTADFELQEFADAIRFTSSVTTPGAAKGVIVSLLTGLVLGVAGGTGLSLLGIYMGKPKNPRGLSA